MIMKSWIRLLLIALCVGGATGVASADVIVADFNTSTGAAIPGSPPYAVATFTLNPDKTIGVDVTAEDGLLITWFLFNKPTGATVSAITPGAVFSGPQIISGFAETGFGACLGGGNCFTDFLTDNFSGEPAPFGTGDLSFTLSTPGGFSSLSGLVNSMVPGATDYPDNTFGALFTGANDQSEAQKYAAIATAVPESSSLPLVCTAIGVIGIAGLRRHRSINRSTG
jgi:hypothetical protein